jgi:hypothetical protein
MLHGFESALDDQSPAAAWAWQCEDFGVLTIVAVSCATCLFPVRYFGPEQASYPGDIGCAITVSEKAVVANAVLALWQHMDQEPADELPGLQRHGGVTARAIDAVVLDFEGHATRIEPDQATVGDRDAVGVAR